MDRVAARTPDRRLQLVLQREPYRRIGRVRIHAEEHGGIVFELVPADGYAAEERGTDLVLGRVSEVIGTSQRAEALQSRLEQRIAAPFHLPAILDLGAGLGMSSELALEKQVAVG